MLGYLLAFKKGGKIGRRGLLKEQTKINFSFKPPGHVFAIYLSGKHFHLKYFRFCHCVFLSREILPMLHITYLPKILSLNATHLQYLIRDQFGTLQRPIHISCRPSTPQKFFIWKCSHQ